MKVNKNTFLILSEKSWNSNLTKELSKNFSSYKWILINNKSDFNLNNLKNIKPEKIFIPHWSHIIPKEIFLAYECIVFHMTDLPFGRGGSPLQNLISRGIYETKISAIKVDKGIDTGDIYLKEDLNLDGSATQIFEKCNSIIYKMIVKIIKNNIKPFSQVGKVVNFKRRTAKESDISKLESLIQVYDYIRMLDADGYPKAFIETKHFKIEFNEADFDNNELSARVKIQKK